MDWNTLLYPIVVAAVPLVVAAIKRAFGVAPWLLPPLVPVLGVAADALTAYLANVPQDPMRGAVLGALGLWLRELLDQLKKATA